MIGCSTLLFLSLFCSCVTSWKEQSEGFLIIRLLQSGFFVAQQWVHNFLGLVISQQSWAAYFVNHTFLKASLHQVSLKEHHVSDATSLSVLDVLPRLKQTASAQRKNRYASPVSSTEFTQSHDICRPGRFAAQVLWTQDPLATSVQNGFQHDWARLLFWMSNYAPFSASNRGCSTGLRANKMAKSTLRNTVIFDSDLLWCTQLRSAVPLQMRKGIVHS